MLKKPIISTTIYNRDEEDRGGVTRNPLSSTISNSSFSSYDSSPKSMGKISNNDSAVFPQYLEKLRSNPYWNIFFLALAWALTLTTSTLLTTIGPLSAKYLGATDALSSFTIGVFLLGAAVSSVPSSFLFRRLGRSGGFSVGCFCQIVGSSFGYIAMSSEIVPLLFIGCFFIGLGQGLGQFYRFSAVELSPESLKTSAVTYVLSGGIIAAFCGPLAANGSIGKAALLCFHLHYM